MTATWCHVHGLSAGACPYCPPPTDLTDLRDELRDLRRRVSALEARANDLQRAHNVLIDDLDAVAQGRCRQHGPWNRTDGMLGCPICGRADDGRLGDPHAP